MKNKKNRSAVHKSQHFDKFDSDGFTPPCLNTCVNTWPSAAESSLYVPWRSGEPGREAPAGPTPVHGQQLDEFIAIGKGTNADFKEKKKKRTLGMDKCLLQRKKKTQLFR